MAEIPAGWPCYLFPPTPPTIEDAEASPSTDAVLGQVAGILTPRGPAWGTDEAGDGHGASPVQLSLWRALSAWLAGGLAGAHLRARQCFPSALTDTLDAWEDELGLPTPGSGQNQTTEERKRAVALKYRATGGASAAYFICLARTAGYDISIEEPESFRCGESTCGEGGDQIGPPTIDATWVVHFSPADEIYFTTGEGGGELGTTPLSGTRPNLMLEALLREHAPTSTIVAFRYAD